MSEELPADIYEIEPAEAYTNDDLDYNNDSCRANQEMDDESARPEVTGLLQMQTVQIFKRE